MAVAQSPVIKCQCSYCNHVMAFKPSLAGRKILCPLCGDPITISQPGSECPQRPFVIRESVDKFKLNEWDRAFARALLEQNKIPDKQFYAAVCDFMKAIKKTSDLSLAGHLENMGLLAPAARDAIRASLKGSVRTGPSEQVECPNCFAKVDSKERACRFCGQRLSDPAFITCPKCKLEQKKRKNAVVCIKCHANLRTGLTQVAGKCPACKQVVFGDPKTCPNCRVVIKSSRSKHSEQKLQFEQARKKLMMGLGAGAAGLILIVILWAPLRTLFRTIAVGYPQASLENRLRDFGDELREGSEARLDKYVTGRVAAEDNEKRLQLICTGSTDGKKITSVRTVKPVEITLGDDDKTAVVTAAVKVTVQQEQSEEAARSLFSRPKIYTVEWAWQRGDGPWQCGGAGN